MRKKYQCLNRLKAVMLCLAVLQAISCWDGLNDMLEEGGSPSAIMFTQSTLTSTSMTINWTDPVSVTGYDHILVTYTPGSSVTLSKGVTSFSVSGLVSSTEYAVTVQAIGKENIIKAQSSFKVTPSGSYILRFIYTAADLDSVRSSLGYYYVVMNDIDLSGYANWTPIGTFSGVFDGQGYNISNLSINSSNQYLGLFSNSSGTLKNSNVSGTIAGSFNDSIFGGLVGVNTGTVRNCSSSVSVTGSGATCCLGGLVGMNSGDIIECFSTGRVNGTGAGGGTYSYLGGLVGLNQVSSGEVTRCYATGEVTGGMQNCRYGGLVGTNYLPITDCYAFGNITVTSNSSTYTGGLVGLNINSNSTTNYCYSVGHVTGGEHVGRLVGDNSGVVTGATSYYNSETTGPPDNGIGDPRTTNQMKLIDTSVTTYSGWDFTTVWGISSGKNGGYPYLRAVTP